MIQLKPTNIFTQTFTCFRGHQTITQIAKHCKKQVKTNVFKADNLKVSDIILRFQILQKKFYDSNSESHRKQWTEDQKRVFLSFLIAFCQLYSKKSSEITETEWGEISEAFGNKDILAMKYEGRVLERSVDRVLWKPEEETLLQNCIESQMKGKWSQISRHLFSQSKGRYSKTPKQCRQHWFNHMNKQIERRSWKHEQDLIILQSVLNYGHKWARIVSLLNGKRTEHMIKNRYHSICTAFNKNTKESKERKNQQQLAKKLIKQINKVKDVMIDSQNRTNSQQFCSKIKQNIKLQQDKENYYQTFQQQTIKNDQIQQPTENMVRIQDNHTNLKEDQAVMYPIYQNFFNIHQNTIQYGVNPYTPFYIYPMFANNDLFNNI